MTVPGPAMVERTATNGSALLIQLGSTFFNRRDNCFLLRCGIAILTSSCRLECVTIEQSISCISAVGDGARIRIRLRLDNASNKLIDVFGCVDSLNDLGTVLDSGHDIRESDTGTFVELVGVVGVFPGIVGIDDTQGNSHVGSTIIPFMEGREGDHSCCFIVSSKTWINKPACENATQDSAEPDHFPSVYL